MNHRNTLNTRLLPLSILISSLFDNSRKGTRVNAGLGANVNVTKNLSVGSEVKVSKGKNVDTPVTINLGVAYSF